MSTATVGRMGLVFWLTKVFGGAAVDRAIAFGTEHAVALLVAALAAPLLWHFGSEYASGAAALALKKKTKPAAPDFVPARGKLFASCASTCSRKVIVTLQETGGEYAFQNIDLAKQEHKAPEYLRMQPYGKVPVWQEDDFRMFESRAIMKHVSEGSALYPGKAKCARTTALIDQWVSIEYSAFQAAWGPLFVDRVLKPRSNPSHVPSEALRAAQALALAPTLDLMNGQLEATGAFLAGQTFTLADVTFLPYVALFAPAGLSAALAERPALATWATACLARPAWKDYAATNQAATRPTHGY